MHDAQAFYCLQQSSRWQTFNAVSSAFNSSLVALLDSSYSCCVEGADILGSEGCLSVVGVVFASSQLLWSATIYTPIVRVNSGYTASVGSMNAKSPSEKYNSWFGACISSVICRVSRFFCHCLFWGFILFFFRNCYVKSVGRYTVCPITCERKLRSGGRIVAPMTLFFLSSGLSNMKQTRTFCIIRHFANTYSQYTKLVLL